jgi:hypothetical protein
MRRGATIAVATWVVAASVVQGLFGAEMDRAGRRFEQRIEERLERQGAPPAEQQPRRSHEVESFEPWELVGV